MPLRAIDRLILIRVKIEWAKKRLRDLATETVALNYVHVLGVDENGVPQHPIAVLSGTVPQVPILSFDAICMAGDVIHNLRAALDHLAQHLAAVHTPTLTAEELKWVKFPIREISGKYKSKDEKEMKGIDPRAIAAIDGLKPYGDGDGEFSAPLWRLHQLDIIDKHRTLFTFGHDFLLTADWLNGGVYHFKAGDPNFTGLRADVEQDVELEIENTVNQAKAGQSNAVLPTLHQFVEVVEKVVLKFEPFLE